jgi:hypothetical protein
MRKALIPMLASLALCGAGTLALIASNDRAQASPRKPFMVALLNDTMLLAQNLPEAAPANETGAPSEFAADPKQFCDDRYAGEVGRIAYLETRLHLNETEQPLFARWKDVRLTIAKRRAADCDTHPGAADRDRADPVARMAREEEMLKQRIADLDAERPAFAALYTALAPDQRQSLSPERPMMRQDYKPRRPFPPNDLPPPPAL